MSELEGIKKYGLVLSDPPWHFKNWSGDAPGMLHNRARGANKHYITTTLDGICNLVPPTEDDAILLIWTISSHLEDTFKVIDAWGFKYKTIAWTWLKISKSGKPRIGMGYYFRQCTEICLLGIKGHPSKGILRNEPALIVAPRSKIHSQKPFEQYDKINRMWPNIDNKLEMFARIPQSGWDVFGNEVENSILLANQYEQTERLIKQEIW